VRALGALLGRRALADDRLAADQRRLRLRLRDCVIAERIAASTASTSWPSTCGITFQPYASKRFGVSSVNQCFASPSIEIPLSS
jgi:hypothetical protein